MHLPLQECIYEIVNMTFAKVTVTTYLESGKIRCKMRMLNAELHSVVFFEVVNALRSSG